MSPSRQTPELQEEQTRIPRPVRSSIRACIHRMTIVHIVRLLLLGTTGETRPAAAATAGPHRPNAKPDRRNVFIPIKRNQRQGCVTLEPVCTETVLPVEFI